MKYSIENICFNLYKSVSPDVVKSIIPVIDFCRKFQNKPPIPLNEKLAKNSFPNFENEKVIMIHGVSVGEVLSLENLT